ncbi:hypothetical protein [Halochromatium salexigens]|uniref:hypothetical protein n=1 Tax=Halochromatium salexigens TaxID=49447 RepID=UPI0019113ADF|nr:hypothetical protein [Halochromatium salexigens]
MVFKLIKLGFFMGMFISGSVLANTLEEELLKTQENEEKKLHLTQEEAKKYLTLLKKSFKLFDAIVKNKDSKQVSIHDSVLTREIDSILKSDGVSKNLGTEELIFSPPYILRMSKPYKQVKKILNEDRQQYYFPVHYPYVFTPIGKIDKKGNLDFLDENIQVQFVNWGQDGKSEKLLVKKNINARIDEGSYLRTPSLAQLYLIFFKDLHSLVTLPSLKGKNWTLIVDYTKKFQEKHRKTCINALDKEWPNLHKLNREESIRSSCY